MTDELTCETCGDNFYRRNFAAHVASCSAIAIPPAAPSKRLRSAARAPEVSYPLDVDIADLDSGSREGDAADDDGDTGSLALATDAPRQSLAAAAAATGAATVAIAGGGRRSRPPVPLHDYAVRHYSDLRAAECAVNAKLTEAQLDIVIAFVKDPLLDPAVISTAKKARRAFAAARSAGDVAESFVGARRILFERPAGAPAHVPAEIEGFTFGVEESFRAILLDHTITQWDRLLHAADLEGPEAPRFRGGPAVEAGCPSMSGLAREDYARSLALNPAQPGTVIIFLPFGLAWDGSKLGCHASTSGYPLGVMPFFLKLPYRWRGAALRRLALLPPVFSKATDSPAQHEALEQLFHEALWRLSLEEIEALYTDGGFFIEGIAGAPVGVRVNARPVFVGCGGDYPALLFMASGTKGRCVICPEIRPPYHAPWAGSPWRTEAGVAAARTAALGATSAAARKRALGLVGVHATPSALSRLTATVWNDGHPEGIYLRLYPDMVLHNTLEGSYVWFQDGLDALLAEESPDGSAAASLDRLVASNAHFSTGNKRWVALRNIRKMNFFSGFMRASQMVMVVAALRASALDLGDVGGLQADLIRNGENLLQISEVLEAEQWPFGEANRLAAMQANAAAWSEETFGHYGHGTAGRPNAHSPHHAVEIATGKKGRGTTVHWDTGRGIEATMPSMHNDYGHHTGVLSPEATIAWRMDDREFNARLLGPVLGRISKAASSAVTVSSSEPPTHPPSAPGGADASDSSADDDLRELSLGAAVPACEPYTRFPDAPRVVSRCTGELWAGAGMQLCGRDGVPRLSKSLCQAFQAAYAVAASGAGLPPFDWQVCLWRRALLLCRPPTLESEGCRRRLPVIPDGAASIRPRDVKLYQRRQPCVQLFVPSPLLGGAAVPDETAMVKIEALVSIDVRRQPASGARLRSLNARSAGGADTADYALVRVLRPYARGNSRCFRGFANEGPSLAGDAVLTPAQLGHFRLVRVTSMCQPRWPFPAFEDEPLPDGDGDILPWDGPFVSVLVLKGA